MMRLIFQFLLVFCVLIAGYRGFMAYGSLVVAMAQGGNALSFATQVVGYLGSGFVAALCMRRMVRA